MQSLYPLERTKKTFDDAVAAPVKVGSLQRVKPIEKNHPGWTVMWNSSDPKDTRSQSIFEDSLVLVLEVDGSYVKVLTPQGQGWVLPDEIKEVV